MVNKTGGPAFPVTRYVSASGETHESRPQGMTLRDYFAAKAMAAIISASDSHSNSVGEIEEWLGDYAYAAADIMLKAREA